MVYQKSVDFVYSIVLRSVECIDIYITINALQSPKAARARASGIYPRSPAFLSRGSTKGKAGTPRGRDEGYGDNLIHRGHRWVCL